MRRRAFVTPRKLAPEAVQASATATPAATPLAVFDCLFTSQCKRGGSAEGTLVLRGGRAQLFDLELRERAAATLLMAAADGLHRAHAAALAGTAAGGPLWCSDPGQEEEPDVVVEQWKVAIGDDTSAAVSKAEWLLRQHVGAEAKGGKPKDVAGAAIPLDSLGARMLAGMGWQPGQGLGRAPGTRTAPVLPQPKWDKGGLGSSTHVKRLGLQATKFRRATNTTARPPANGAAAAATAAAHAARAAEA